MKFSLQYSKSKKQKLKIFKKLYTWLEKSIVYNLFLSNKFDILCKLQNQTNGLINQLEKEERI